MKRPLICILLLLFSGVSRAQLDLQCEGRDLHSVYIVSTNNGLVYRVDSVDSTPSVLKPVQTVPPSTIGISINANLNSVAGPTTMYFVNSSQAYYYWNGLGWTNTGHLSGGISAVNPGGTSDYIFNCNSSGVYRYDGSANGTLIAGVPWSSLPDVATDSLGNYYLFSTSSQTIVAYTFNGVPIDTFAVTGYGNIGGGGFALLGNRFYAESIYNLHQGIIINDTVHFSILVPHPNIMSNDIAVCPTSGFPVAVFEYPELPHIAVFPNPAADVATVNLNNTVTLEVYDCLGVLHQRIPVKGLDEYRLELNRFSAGIYFINAISKDNTTATFKLVVQ